MHRTVTLTSKFHYADTDVPLDKSLEKVKVLLRKHGCDDILVRERVREDGATEITLMFKQGGVPYMIEFPVTYIEKLEMVNRFQKKVKRLKMEIAGRIVFHNVKALLVDVDLGMLDFTQAMMRHIALPGPSGMTTLEDKVMESLDQVRQGRFDLKLLPGGTS